MGAFVVCPKIGRDFYAGCVPATFGADYSCIDANIIVLRKQNVSALRWLTMFYIKSWHEYFLLGIKFSAAIRTFINPYDKMTISSLLLRWTSKKIASLGTNVLDATVWLQYRGKGYLLVRRAPTPTPFAYIPKDSPN